jgi:hypothetical protein
MVNFLVKLHHDACIMKYIIGLFGYELGIYLYYSSIHHHAGGRSTYGLHGEFSLKEEFGLIIH